jgi:hypothetical protein
MISLGPITEEEPTDSMTNLGSQPKVILFILNL